MAVESTSSVVVDAPSPGLRAATSRWFHKTFDSLRDRNLRILWIGTLVNFAAISMNQTAQGVVAFDLTGNSRAVGAVSLGMGLSMLFIAPLGGALADRVAKRAMLLICQAILGLTFFFIAFALYSDFISIPLLAGSAFISGMMFAMIRSVRNAYIGEVAPPEQRGNAVALGQLAMTVTQVSGPFLASILIGWSLFKAQGTYSLMGIFFTIGLITMLQLPKTKAPQKAAGAPNILQDTIGGMKYAYNHPEIRWVLGGFLLLTIVGNPYISLMPGYVNRELGESTAKLGMLLGVSAVGGFMISLVAASMADSARAPRLLFVCNVIFGLSLLGLAFAPNLPTAAVVMLFLGIGTSGFQVLNLAVALRAADVKYMGRIASLTMMAMSVSSLVALPMGWLADEVGDRPVIMAMGCAVLVVAFVLAGWRGAAGRKQAAAA